jgi:hypothetical protein
MTLSSISKKIISPFLGSNKADHPKTQSSREEAKAWMAAQKYELEHAIGFMQESHFQCLFSAYKADQLWISKGYVPEIIVSEFFGGSELLWKAFVTEVSAKTCMDIGPCVFSPLACWDMCSTRIAIEPLGTQISAWQSAHLGSSTFDDLILEPCGADVFLPKYENKIDGAIFCRNMLDHTPNWPFVLDNISRYARSGSSLLLWCDIFHHGLADAGHFEITEDEAAFKRLIESFGFAIEYEFSIGARAEKNYGVRARKK